MLRHSTAHLMAQAVQSLFPGTQVTIGPVIEDGFFYDFAPPTPFTSDDLPRIEAKMRELAKADFRVERVEMDRAEAIKLLRGDGRALQGRDPERHRRRSRVDLQAGRLDGSLPRPARALDRAYQGFQAHQRGRRVLARRRAQRDALADLRDLVRIKDALEEHLKLLELARARDHRKLGREMGLFLFDPIAPGSPFFLPKGAIIYNQLVEYIRRLYRRYGFDEVITPQIYKNELWQTLGPLGQLPREHVPYLRSARARKLRARQQSRGLAPGLRREADELPGPYLHLPRREALVSRPAAALRRLRPAPSRRALGHAARPHARAHDGAGRRAHLLRARANRRRDQPQYPDGARRLPGAGIRAVESKVATMPEKHLGTEEQWRRNEKILGDALTRNGFP